MAADQGTSRSSHRNADPAAIATGEGRSSTGTQEATDDRALNAAVVVHLFGGRRVLTGALDCGRGVAGDLDLLAPLLDVARGVLGSRDVLLAVFVLKTLAGLGITRRRNLLSHGREHLG